MDEWDEGAEFGSDRRLKMLMEDLQKDDGLVGKESGSIIGESRREFVLGRNVWKVKEALNGLLAFDLITAYELCSGNFVLHLRVSMLK